VSPRDFKVILESILAISRHSLFHVFKPEGILNLAAKARIA